MVNEVRKMIYTSYFAQLRNLPENIIPVSICGKAPNWYHGYQYKKLAPKYDFFMEWKKNHDNNYYIKCFNEQVLGNLNAIDVILDLSRMIYSFNIGESDICLVCYEKPDDFCHRHLVAQWLRDNGFSCAEWIKE
jgi:hypothetical protein